jgi:hypothetical protein
MANKDNQLKNLKYKMCMTQAQSTYLKNLLFNLNLLKLNLLSNQILNPQISPRLNLLLVENNLLLVQKRKRHTFLRLIKKAGTQGAACKILLLIKMI